MQLGFSFDTTTGKNLELWRNAVLKQDIDFCALVDGGEGFGKSVFGMQVACFLDIERSIDIETQICYTPEQFKNAVMTLKPGKSIVWDEARRGVNRRRHSDNVNLEITDLLAECRQHNLFLVVIMPSFYDMDMNVAVWRSRVLFHVYNDWDVSDRETPLRRGFFRFYNEEGKKQLYTNKLHRQSYRYPLIKGNSFDAKFPHHYVVDEAEYRKRKRASEEFYRGQQKKAAGVPQVIIALKEAQLFPKGAIDVVAKAMGVSSRTVSRWCQTDAGGITTIYPKGKV